jgi:hypothetical protein
MPGNQLPMPGGEQRDQTKFIVFENFEKMNTQSIRQSLSEKELAWLENLQPIASNNLTTVPAPAATAIANIGETISVMYYAALLGVDYFVVFTTAGAGYLINIATGGINQFGTDGTYSPQPDVTTWQASRLLIADPIAGYSTYDGTILVGQGGVSPNITVTNGGTGYGVAPTVTISGGSGSGATAHAVVQNGSVIQVILDNPGHGYQVGDVLTVTFGTGTGSGATAHVTMTGFPATSILIQSRGDFTSPSGVGAHQLSFSGGGGTGARGFCIVASEGGTGRTVTSVVLTSPGSGYTSPPTATLSTSGGPGPVFVVTLGTQSVATIVLDTAGSGYTGPPSATIVSSDGIGSGAAAVTTESGGAVTSISLVASAVAAMAIAYQGVSSTPGSFALSFSGGGGTGATGTATIGNYTDDTDSTSVGVTSVALTSGGSGYTTAPTVAVVGATFSAGPTILATIASQGAGYDVAGGTPAVFIGSGGGATATAHVWPFINSTITGDAFTTLAVFQGRVWLGGGNLLTWSGTGASYGGVAYDDFLAADASGSLIISDADLIHAITALRAYNNYLFIMGDQSVKQIGNITLGGLSLDQTLFTILTLSSDQGTIYKKSCISYNRVFMFANSNGIYGVFGSSVQKLSGDMDGIWNLVDFTQQPQGALADINGIHNAVFLIRYKDPLSTTRSIMLMFDGKRWWVLQQGNSLTAVATSASLPTGQLSLYGSSGPDVTHLLAVPTLQVSFKIQTSLSHHGNAVQRKRLIAAGISYNLSAFTVAGATIAAGGSGGTPDGFVVLTVVGGTGTAATLSGTITGGVLTGALGALSGGVYSILPTNPAAVTGGGLVGATVNLIQGASSLTETVEATNDAINITVPLSIGFHSPGGVANVGGAGKYLGMTLTGTLSGFTIVNLEMEYQESELWR